MGTPAVKKTHKLSCKRLRK